MTKDVKENIVLSGGGVLGIAYIGALQAVDDWYPIKDIKRFAGNSIGSLVATIAALGYSCLEMQEMFIKLDLKKLAPESFTSFLRSRDIFGDETIDFHKTIDFLLSEDGGYGINDGNYFESWIDDIICAKVGKKNATFADLKSNEAFAELYITATNLSKEESTVFSAKNTPDVVISKAVRASTSMPIFFDVVKINGDVYVDGGIYDNFPFYIFNDQPFNKTLGLTFTPHSIIDKTSNQFSWKKYLLQLLTATFVSQAHYLSAYTENIQRTIAIDNLGISTLDFALTDKQKEQLLEVGKHDAKRWLGQ